MQCAHDPLYDIDPRTGATIEVFYADRELETFGSAALVGFGGLADVALRQTLCQATLRYDARTTLARHSRKVSKGPSHDLPDPKLWKVNARSFCLSN